MEKILFVGAGGHCKVILSMLDTARYIPFGISNEDPKLFGKTINGYKILFNESQWKEIRTECSNALVAFGNVDIPLNRKKVWEKLKALNFGCPIIISKHSILANNIQIGEGTVIMPGAIINTGSIIGKNCIINTGAIIDHDCVIGDHTHIAPGVTCSGGVTIGETAHIGTGTSIIQGISIGSFSLAAAGSVVVKDIPAHTRVKGIPARTF